MRKLVSAIFGFFRKVFGKINFNEIQEIGQKVVNITETIKSFVELSNADSFIAESAYTADDKIYEAFLKVSEELHWGLGIVKLGNEGATKTEIISEIADKIKFNYTDTKVRLGIYHMLATEVLHKLVPKVDKSVVSVTVAFVYSKFIKRAETLSQAA